jgi:hypothetical protein
LRINLTLIWLFRTKPVIRLLFTLSESEEPHRHDQ